MILSARFVKNPQTDNLLICEYCYWPIVGEHIRLYGMAEPDEKPHTLRMHIGCASDSVDLSREPKLAKAIFQANESEGVSSD